MLINRHYRFIFLHVPKTGGTSMMQHLRKLDGNCPHWVAQGTKHETLVQLRSAWPIRRTPDEVASEESLDGYFVFGFVRNPWARMSSLFRYLVEARPRPEIVRIRSFEEFLTLAIAGEPWIRSLHSMRPQLDFLRDCAHSIEPNFIGHFEHIAEDFATVAAALQFPITSLPHHNRSSNSERDYRNDYSPQMVDVVASLFSEEVKVFGYCFESPLPARRASMLAYL